MKIWLCVRIDEDLCDELVQSIVDRFGVAMEDIAIDDSEDDPTIPDPSPCVESRTP